MPFPSRFEALPARWATAALAIGALWVSAPSPTARAQGADLVCSDIPEVGNYVAHEGIDAFSVGTTACNVGDVPLDWIADTDEHPVIAQNMYRFFGGRFEQIGASWLKHGFATFEEEFCTGLECVPGGGLSETLGVGCSDTYSAVLNGMQSTLGPRSLVDPVTAGFEYPFDAQDYAHRIDRRLQVAVADLAPELNPGATYIVEGRYLAAQDAAAGNDDDNASWRPATIEQIEEYDYFASIVEDEPTRAGQTAIEAWQELDPEVALVTLDIEGDGRLLVGSRVTERQAGIWDYEYAIQNWNSAQGVRALRVPLPEGIDVSETGFHDVDAHSGEPFDGTDWAIEVGGGEISWNTSSHDDDPDANALRWGTLYNFRFSCNAPPTAVDSAEIELFAPGATDAVTFLLAMPSADFPLPVESLACRVEDDDVDLAWENAADYDSIAVFLDGEQVASLDGAAEDWTDESPLAGIRIYSVRGLTEKTASGARACSTSIELPLLVELVDEAPGLIDPDGAVLAIEVRALAGRSIDARGIFLHVSSSASAVSVPFTAVGDGRFEAVFPVTECGAEITWYVSAAATNGVRVTVPPLPYSSPFVARSAAQRRFAFDDMEFDHGWSGAEFDDDATTGQWVREIPLGTDAQPNADRSAAPGERCWFTGQGKDDAFQGSHDVDDGSTTLTSPVFRLADAFEARVSYWRWYSNSAGASPETDVLRVELTVDGSRWIEVEEVGPRGQENAGGWIFHEFDIAEFAAPSDLVQVRFVASDLGAPSLVEAAIDDFRIEGLLCEPDCDADGVDDSVQIASDPKLDCDGNGLPDECDRSTFLSLDLNGNGMSDECEPERLIRGDCNEDGDLNIADPIGGLAYLYLDGAPPVCEDTCDVNDDGALSIGDMVLLLAWLFSAGTPPAAPYPECGLDPTDDELRCLYSVGGCE